MCKFSSKSGGGVPFQISFFLGDLTRNDPLYVTSILMYILMKFGIKNDRFIYSNSDDIAARLLW